MEDRLSTTIGSTFILDQHKFQIIWIIHKDIIWEIHTNPIGKLEYICLMENQ